MVVIVGPSGSGKSTFLRTLNQLEQPSTMAISWSTASAPPNPGMSTSCGRGGHGVPVLQLFPHLTVLDNITLAPRR